MRTIWKFPLQFNNSKERVFIKGPRGLKPLTVGIDPDTSATCIWARADTEKEQVEHTVRVYGTGHELTLNTNDTDFVGTVVYPDGLVFHYYLDVKR